MPDTPRRGEEYVPFIEDERKRDRTHEIRFQMSGNIYAVSYIFTAFLHHGADPQTSCVPEFKNFNLTTNMTLEASVVLR